MKNISVRTLCQVALLIALEVVLNRFGSINTMGLKIGLSFIPIALCGMLFGPVWAAVAGGLADFLGATLFPIGPYFPGFTVVAAITGAVYGIFLYKKENLRFFSEILTATVINCLICGLLINTYWVSLLYDSRNYWGWFVYRLPQYAVLIPVHLVILPILPKLTTAIRKAGLIK